MKYEVIYKSGKDTLKDKSFETRAAAEAYITKQSEWLSRGEKMVIREVK